MDCVKSEIIRGCPGVTSRVASCAVVLLPWEDQPQSPEQPPDTPCVAYLPTQFGHLVGKCRHMYAQTTPVRPQPCCEILQDILWIIL